MGGMDVSLLTDTVFLMFFPTRAVIRSSLRRISKNFLSVMRDIGSDGVGEVVVCLKLSEIRRVGKTVER